MKLYAKQIDPSYQESPFYNVIYAEKNHPGYFVECYPNLVITGNNYYISRTSEIFDTVRNALYDGELFYIIENFNDYKDFYKTVTEAIMDFIPPVHKEKYTTNEIGAIKKAVAYYQECRSSEEDDTLCNLLSIVTGKTWEHKTIRGSVQSDWNECFYSTDDYSNADINRLEMEYFNEGTGWIIHDEDTEPETAEDISGYFQYCYGWNVEQIKQELIEAANFIPDEVVLYKFDHYLQVPVYEIA